MSLLVVGTVAFDSVETPDAFRECILGGSATYFSYAASFFAPVRLVGIVGKDWPEGYSRLLRQRGIDLAGLEKSETNDTYFWHGKYTTDLQDRMTVAWETNGFDKHTPVVPPQFQDSKTVFLGAAAPQIQLHTLDQCQQATLVVADTVDAWIETARGDLDRLLSRVDCLLINDSEARQYTQEKNLIRAGKRLQSQGPSKVILKKGEHGCLYFSGDNVFPCPAFPTANVVDPTGAGDSFAGGMLGFLNDKPIQDDRTWLQAIQMGTIVASFAVAGFSLEGFEQITMDSLQERFELFRRMMTI